MKTLTVYVALLDEGTNVWAPVEAERIAASVYRIVGHRNGDEKAEFEPGDLVRCRFQTLSGDEVLVAYARSN